MLFQLLLLHSNHPKSQGLKQPFSSAQVFVNQEFRTCFSGQSLFARTGVTSQTGLQPSLGFNWAGAPKVSHSRGGNWCWLLAGSSVGLLTQVPTPGLSSTAISGWSDFLQGASLFQSRHPNRTSHKLHDLKGASKITQHHVPCPLSPKPAQPQGEVSTSLPNGSCLKDVEGPNL